MFAARAGHFELLKWLKEQGCPGFDTILPDILTFACEGGFLDIAIWATENGCDENLDDINYCRLAAEGRSKDFPGIALLPLELVPWAVRMCFSGWLRMDVLLEGRLNQQTNKTEEADSLLLRTGSCSSWLLVVFMVIAQKFLFRRNRIAEGRMAGEVLELPLPLDAGAEGRMAGEVLELPLPLDAGAEGRMAGEVLEVPLPQPENKEEERESNSILGKPSSPGIPLDTGAPDTVQVTPAACRHYLLDWVVSLAEYTRRNKEIWTIDRLFLWTRSPIEFLVSKFFLHKHVISIIEKENFAQKSKAVFWMVNVEKLIGETNLIDSF